LDSISNCWRKRLRGSNNLTEDIYAIFQRPKDPTDFEAVRIRLASPEKIREWSYGEVKKPETINYRTFKPERDGLFCAKIFGPIKDWECICGKYKRMKHRGVVCDKCGVEVIQSKVRRERLGHIELATPVAHIWFLKGLPSRIGTLLDMTMRQLEKVLYFESYVIIDAGDTPLKEKEPLTEEDYRKKVSEYGSRFKAGMGAEAIRELLRRIDLQALYADLKTKIQEAVSIGVKKKLTKRLKVVDAFRKSGNKPEWMIMDVVPVLPPDLRPLVPLEGGRFATSDLNDLYRRVINRNNRLKRLMELKAPSVIIKNEKRMLQEAVDALFDNGRRSRVLKTTTKRPLKSLSDMIKGKQGRFRQNLLGKRVDYSGRSVIVVGPDLKLHQCGLPKRMALELFKPFIFNKLEDKGYATTIKAAKKLVEKESPEVWDALEEVIREHPVLLNRAPTLHRLGIQGFDPVLVEGKAIKLHPLVCTAFNADFDGDQMAVHVPLSIEAQIEARVLMMAVNNILSPANGKPIVVPTQDMVLGIYYLMKERTGAKGERIKYTDEEIQKIKDPAEKLRAKINGKYLTPEDVRIAYDSGLLSEHAKIELKMNGEFVETTVGRVIFSEILPPGVPFSMINKDMTKKELGKIIEFVYKRSGKRHAVVFLDNLESLGFKYATKSGVSISMADMHIPSKKPELIRDAEQEVIEVQRQYADGLITHGERYNKVIDIWANVTEKVAEEMMKELGAEEEKTFSEEELKERRSFNSVFMMADSGARGSTAQIRQLAGMRGLMAKPSGEIIETPITANFREGLTPLQYFISTHGARKGLADTALKTANSGYLTRRLVDVAQDVIIAEDDCGTTDGIIVNSLVEGGEIIQPIEERLIGRTAVEDIRDPLTKEVIIKRNQEIDEEVTQKIVDAGIDRVKIRSVLTCQAKFGVCTKCYGRDLGRGEVVEKGESVGIVAAQSIGEPGTQLTMRTFHIGGAASKVVEQTILQAKNSGTIKFVNINTVKNREGLLVVMNRNGSIAIADSKGREKEKYSVVYGAKLMVEDGRKVEAGQKLVEWDPYSMPILTELGGRIAHGDITEGQTVKEEVDEVTGLSHKVIIDYPANMRPRISIKDEHGKSTLKIPGTNVLARYLLPAGAHILVDKNDIVFPGDILAKIPRETTKTKDITGGLPRVAELFEARRPKEQAIVTEIDGMVEFRGAHKGMRVVVVRGGDETREYLIPKGKHVGVHEGDWVRAGEPLMDGAVNPHNILDILGPQELQRYLVDEVQKVYRLQGVTINDKHIEVIVRQMMKKVRVEDPGDTNFLISEQVDRRFFQEENIRIREMGGTPAQGKPLLLGITKASLTTDSFVSAASFQETTRVLTEAAIGGAVDELRGLKENVIMGRIIPAGTGMPRYRNTFVKREFAPLLPEPQVEEQNA
jgi:DNA-directed RNA polymerase beta' subunit